jgi:hypothetical protein
MNVSWAETAHRQRSVFASRDRQHPFRFGLFDVSHQAIDIFYFVVFECRQVTPGLEVLGSRLDLGLDLFDRYCPEDFHRLLAWRFASSSEGGS